MKTFTRTFMRPHTEAEWYTPSATFLAWIQENYIDTGICTKFREATFADSSKLVTTLTSSWSDDVDVANIASQAEWANELALEIEHNTAWEIILLNKDSIN